MSKRGNSFYKDYPNRKDWRKQYGRHSDCREFDPEDKCGVENRQRNQFKYPLDNEDEIEYNTIYNIKHHLKKHRRYWVSNKK